jgi:hypothetical protein
VRLGFVVPGALLGAGLVLHPVSLVRATPFVMLAGGLAFAGFAAALATGSWSMGGAAAGCYLVQYTAALLLAPRVDLVAPIAALGLLLLLEMIDASRVMAPSVVVEGKVVRRHVRDTAWTAALGGIAATGVLLAAAATRGGGAIGLVIGAGCLLGALAVGVSAARRGVLAHERGRI